MKNWFRIDHLLSTLLVFAFMAFLPWFFSIDFFDPLQSTIEDMTITDIVFGHVRDYENIETDTNIVIINNSHLSRGAFAEQLEMIMSYQPAIVAIDAFYRKPKDPDEDEYLSYILSEYDNIILVNELDINDKGELESIKSSNPIFSDYADEAYANMVVSDEDFRTVRRIAPIFKVEKWQDRGDTVFNSLSVAVSQHYAPDKTKRYLERDNELELVNFKRNIGKGYTYFDVREMFENPDLLEAVTGKIVLIGYLGPTTDIKSTEDIFYTPMNEAYVGKAEPDMYGVVIHANAISMILEEDYLTQSPDWLPYLLMVVVIYINMVMLWTFRRKYLIWSQLLTIAFVLGQLIFLPVVVVLLLHWFDFELSMGSVFFAIIVCVLCFEMYNDSLKPLGISTWNKLRGKTA
jgi:CHASE2 domain-containing sensor protein